MTITAWIDFTLHLLDASGAEAALGEVISAARSMSRRAFTSRWWAAPVGLIEDPSATAADALAYAEAMRALGMDEQAEELVAAVWLAALGASPRQALPRFAGAGVAATA